MARPKREIDEKRVAELGFDGCSTRTIGQLLGVPESTIRGRFRALLDKKRAERKYAIRKAQFELALAGNATMLIWLGKNILGQSNQGNIATDGPPPPLYLKINNKK